jgi:site-specific recombinase XerD
MSTELLLSFHNYLLQGKNKASKATVKNYLADVRKFINWFELRFHASFTPSLVSTQVIEAYKQSLLVPESQISISSAKSLKRYLSSLRKFYQFLITAGLTDTNPFLNDIAKPVVVDPWKTQAFTNFLILAKMSKVTLKNYVMDIRQFQQWYERVGAIQDEAAPFQSITRATLEEYKNRMLYEAGFSAVSINRKLSSLRKYFSWLQSQGVMKETITIDKAEVASDDIKEPQTSNQNVLLLEDLPAIGQEKQFSQFSQAPTTNEYSSFGPFRFFQKLGKGSNKIFDLLILWPVVAALTNLKYHFWKLKGAEVFAPLETVAQAAGIATKAAEVQTTAPVTAVTASATALDSFMTKQPHAPVFSVGNIAKSFYAPLGISTKNFPFLQKILHHLRHKRPAWYRQYHSYPFVHYLHFAVFLVYATILGLTIYKAFVGSSIFSAPVLASLPASPPRTITFSGTLTDAQDNPITTDKQLRFSLYTSPTASGEAMLWQENQGVKPDQNGKFSVTLGKQQPLYQSMLNDNPLLYVGITIGTGQELNPRQQIATVAYSKEAETVQGLSPITDPDAGTNNVLLALDSTGNLTIGGSASPRFEATGGQFVLAGKTLVLTTSEGSNTNVQISPDGSGIIDLQKPIQNTTNYNNSGLASGAVEVADSLVVNATDNIQSALIINQNSTGNLISASGSGTAKFTVNYVGGGMFASDLAVNGNNLTTKSPTFNLLNSNVINLKIAETATAISIGAKSGETTINNSIKVLGTGSFAGALNVDGMLSANQGFAAKGSSTNSIAQIFNTDTGSDADGLVVKLGATNPGTANNFVSFTNGSDTVMGKITGNGGNNVIYNTSGADYAEYYKKAYFSEEFEPGDIVCLSTWGGVTKCDQENDRVLGVVSNTAGFVGAGNHDNDPAYVLVGIVGQLQVKVGSSSASLAPGDAIRLGSQGLTKATKAGIILGHILDGYYGQEKVTVALNIGWYDPTVKLTDSGDVIPPSPQETEIPAMARIIDGIKLTGMSLQNYVDKLINDRMLAMESSFFTKQLVTPIAEVHTLKTKIISPLSPDATIALELGDNSITITNPKASNSAVATIDNRGNARLAGDLQAQNASFSGTIRAQRIIADEIVGGNTNVTNVTNIYNTYATPSAPLRSSDLSGQAVTPTPGPQRRAVARANRESAQQFASGSATTAYVPSNALCSTTSSCQGMKDSGSFSEAFAKFNNGLIALGASSFTDVAITGELHMGDNMIISNNSINTVGSDLALQSLRQGNISLMGDLVTIDTEGNLNVAGNATFARDVTIRGKLTSSLIAPVPDEDLLFQLPKTQTTLQVRNANGASVLIVSNDGNLRASGSATFKDVITNAFSIVRGAQADSSVTRTTANASAGVGVINAKQTERTIVSPYMKQSSLVYITTTSNPQGAIPYVARQTKDSFTVQIPNYVTKDIRFNWWIVN